MRIYDLYQLLEKLSKSPCSEDIAFANKCIVAKRNRFKDKFPCELSYVCWLMHINEVYDFMETTIFLNTVIMYADSTNFLHLPYNSASNGTDYINATFISVRNFTLMMM